MTKQERDAAIAALMALPCEDDEPKWVPEVGELCEVWEGDEIPENPQVSRFHHFTKHGVFVSMDDDGTGDLPWTHYRKLHTPATKRTHDGGERPVDEETLVVIELRNEQRILTMAGRVDWFSEGVPVDITHYWVLED